MRTTLFCGFVAKEGKVNPDAKQGPAVRVLNWSVILASLEAQVACCVHVLTEG